MPLDPLYSLQQDPLLDLQRNRISIAADRLSRFAGMVMELIEMRADDRAQALRESCAEQMGAMNKGFTELGRLLAQEPALRAKEFFDRAEGKGLITAEERRAARQLEEAEADAAAGR